MTEQLSERLQHVRYLEDQLEWATEKVMDLSPQVHELEAETLRLTQDNSSLSRQVMLLPSSRERRTGCARPDSSASRLVSFNFRCRVSDRPRVGPQRVGYKLGFHESAVCWRAQP